MATFVMMLRNMNFSVTDNSIITCFTKEKESVLENNNDEAKTNIFFAGNKKIEF